MAQEQTRTGNLVDTTDCLEAVSVIRCWKNLLFVVIVLILLLLQGSFWLMNLNVVKGDTPAGEPATGISAKVQQASETTRPAPAPSEKVRQAAKHIAPGLSAPAEPNTQEPEQVSEPNQPAMAKFRVWFEPNTRHLLMLVRLLNFVVIPAGMLYCLTLLFCLKISLIGRLGGINHVARAFFLSLLFVILLLPWQLLFAPAFAGAMFTPKELLAACEVQKTTSAYVAFYLRFTGYWLIVLLLLLFAQIRSMRWARATLRRLEVI